MRDMRFASFVEPARRAPSLWRLAAGLLLCVGAYGLAAIAVLAAVGFAAGPGNREGWFVEFFRAETPRAVMAHLAVFLGMALGPMAAVLCFHKRRPATLFGRAPVVLRHFVIAAAVTGVVAAVAIGLSLLLVWPVPGRAFDAWLSALPLALLLVALQTGAEELLFRGYLQQQLAARFGSPLIWAVVPSLVFGALHYAPSSAGANAWMVAGAAALFGLAAADLTARTGSIGAAWGFHFANNVVALLLVATDGALSGLALYRMPYRMDDPAVAWVLPIDLLSMALIWFVLRRLLAR